MKSRRDRRRLPEGSTPDAARAPAGTPHSDKRLSPTQRRRASAPAAHASVFPALVPDAALESKLNLRWLLFLALGVGLALRLTHVYLLRDSPFFASLLLDARAYDEWAQRIADGAWIGRTAFWVDPLYAYVLAALYWLGGHNLLLPRLVNAAFGLTTALVVGCTALRVWRSRVAALVATLLVVLFVPAIHFEGQIEKTALSVLLLAAAVYLFLVGTPRAIVAAGVVAGLATLARGNALVFVPLAGLALALGWDREPGDPLAATRRRRMQRTALFLAGALPVIALATAHNYLATGEFVPITTNLGINLYLGNHAGNTHGYYQPPDFLRPNTQSEVPDFRAEAQRRTGRDLSDRALSTYWASQTWEAVKADPGLAMVRTLHKLQLVLHNSEVPDSEGVDLIVQWSPVLRSPLFWFGQLIPLAVLGAVVGWRRRGVRIVVAVAATYALSLLPFFIMARLRVQLLPPLAVLASGAVAWVAAAVRAGQRWPLMYAGTILAASAVVAYYSPQWLAQRRTASLAIEWNNLGGSLLGRGRTDDAIRAYERSIEIDAAAVPAALRTLGSLYQDRGDYPRAEANMRRVVALRPGSPSAREALRQLYNVMLQDPRWRDDAQVHSRRAALGASSPPVASAATAQTDPIRTALSRARSLQAAGSFDEAIAVLQSAVRDGPYDEGLHYMLGNLMERHASADAMVEFFSAEAARDQKPQTSHYFWAVGLARRGDVDGATAHLRRALEIDPAHEMSQWQWGLQLERQGQLNEALEHLVEATRIHPEFKGALQDAARVAQQLGRKVEAEAYLGRAAAADPNSVRRFLYWARYLHAHGRAAPAWAEVNRFLEQRPDDTEGLRLRELIRANLGDAGVVATARAAPAAPTDADPAWRLSHDARRLLVSKLSSEPAGSATWIVYDARYPAAKALALQLRDAFEEAGWTVRRLGATSFPMRPGLFLFAADDPAAPAASAVESALAATPLHATLGTGYRAFVEERRRATPGWRGIEFEPDQTFVIAVGRQPER